MLLGAPGGPAGHCRDASKACTPNTVTVQTLRSEHREHCALVSDLPGENDCQGFRKKHQVKARQEAPPVRQNQCADSLTVYIGKVQNLRISDIMSGVMTQNGNNKPGFQRNSYLRRSDSYRKR